MIEKTVSVASRVGLHARPARVFVQAAAASGHKVTLISSEGRTANAASILGVLALGIVHGEEVTVASENPDAAAAVDSLVELLRQDLEGE